MQFLIPPTNYYQTSWSSSEVTQNPPNEPISLIPGNFYFHETAKPLIPNLTDFGI